MKEKVDQEMQEGLTQALTALREMRNDMEEKKDKKLWKEIDVSLTLYDGLNRLTKYDLDNIRRQLDIKNASSLKKAALIALLEEKIPETLKQTCLQWDTDRFRILRKTALNGGYILASNLGTRQIEFFHASGVIYTGIFNGEKVFVLPKELIKQVQLLDNDPEVKFTVARNTEWIKLSLGLLYYYGTLSLTQLEKMLQTYTKAPPDLFEYLTVMHCANFDNGLFHYDEAGFSNVRVFDPKRVKAEHRMRKDLSFYPFTKEQLLKAGVPGFVERNKSYDEFIQFIMQNYEMGKQEADSIVEECVYATRIGQRPKDVLQFLSNTFEIASMETVRALMDRVVHLMNNTREWFLKGYMSSELLKQEQLLPLPEKHEKTEHKKQVKVGRNDLCPCGSGKKYKKCCGK